MNKLLLQIFATMLIFVCVIFGIANNAIKDKQFTCNRYILNTYLYVILSLNLIALQVLFMEYFNVNFMPSWIVFLGIFILTIICVIALHKISPKKIILKHVIWVLFLGLIGLSFYPMYLLYINQKHLILSAIITTLLLFLGLSLLAYLRPDLISLSWGPVLLVILIGIIIMELIVGLLFSNGETRNWLLRMISYLVIILFMVFILYDTKRLQINAKKCVVADYIKESMGLFLDIWNIFVRILSLKGK